MQLRNCVTCQIIIYSLFSKPVYVVGLISTHQGDKSCIILRQMKHMTKAVGNSLTSLSVQIVNMLKMYFLVLK